MYIDSNIFIFAATNKGELGQNCRQIIELIEQQRISCAASYLVIDEVMWILQKNVGKENAIDITKAMLSLPLKWIDVGQSVIIRTLDIYERTILDPRDAIHYSSMKETGLSLIVSEDGDFDGLAGMERLNASECVERYNS